MSGRTIAIPVAEAEGLGSPAAPHFGDAAYYLVVEVEGADVRSVRQRSAPARATGRWDCRAKALLKALDCDVVLAPRIGGRAREILAEFDVETATGRDGTARELLAGYLAHGSRPNPVEPSCPRSTRGRFTAAAHAGGIDRATGSVVPPIYQTSTFAFEDAAQGALRFAGEEGGYVYTRMGNPTVRALEDCVADLEGEHGALLVVDNTFMSPYLQRPLEHGADVVVHSMTKFLNGHSDVVAGMIVTRTPELHETIRKTLLYHGGTIDPHQAYLVLRGIKTLPLRMEKAQSNARRLALLDAVEVPALAVSLGGIESLIQHPASMTHAAMRPEDRLAAGITDGLVRLSVGCEDFEDLEEDLLQALAGI